VGAQLAAVAVAVWLTASPAVLGSGPRAAASAHIVGPLAAMFALVAAFEVTRPVRWLNLPVGVWLLAVPWVAAFSPTDLVNSTAAGVALPGLARVRGRRVERFGGGWSAVWNGNPAAA